ncbi:MAG: hypothetical protein GY922_09040 [Proteobacteria bacterium]|nr:hypothetical protein [Pseudomonadota bacterium]
MNAPSRWAHVIGGFLVCASLFFVFDQAWSFRDQLATWRPSVASLIGLVVGIFVYAGACIPLAMAWRRILISLEGKSLEADELLLILARSQLGKYLPGNVAHLAGRHLITRDLGYSNWALVMSIAYEFSGLLSAAGTLCVIILIAADSAFLGQHPLMLVGPALVFVLPLLHVTHRLMPKLFKRLRVAPLVDNTSHFNLLVFPYIYYMLFFLLAGSSLVLLIIPLGGSLASVPWFLIWMSFAVSWVLGFLTPGAPSGIGVREAILVYILSPILGPPQAIVAAVLLRLVTITGDVIFWLAVEHKSRHTKKV